MKKLKYTIKVKHGVGAWLLKVYRPVVLMVLLVLLVVVVVVVVVQPPSSENSTEGKVNMCSASPSTTHNSSDERFLSKSKWRHLSQQVQRLQRQAETVLTEQTERRCTAQHDDES